MKGPLPISFEKESVSVFCWGRPLIPALLLFLAFCLSPPLPLSRDPFHKDLPSPLYIIQSSYLGWNPSFVWNVLSILHRRAVSCCCVSAAIMQSWRVQDLPYWWDEVLCCVVWWKKAEMVSMNGRAPPSRCANAIMASQYAGLGKTDIFSIYIWRTENGTEGDSLY